MSVFAIGERDFTLDGEPFQIISGAIHYFRVHPDSWRDRIRKARLMGLNTIETYVAWNFHAPSRDEFHTDGARDLGRFLDIIQEEGLRAIVRPGPYICAEWDNGGLPTWLTATPDIVVRSSDPTYLTEVERYLEHLAHIVEPRQINHGGPIILMQVENEYGAYGNDRAYLTHLTNVYRNLGFVVPLTTVDQPMDDMLAHGTLPDLHTTGSFGSRIDERLATLREHQTTGPLMCSEFWIGWFDHWGAHHHTTDVADAANALDRLLGAGASVNIYMFHGGTNFGFTNGANDKGVYQPLVTSYDYDAPLAEDGYPTEKYWAFREVIARYAPVPAEVPAERPLVAERSVPLTHRVGWLDVPLDVDEAVTCDSPATFDGLNVSGPFVVYERDIAVEGDAVLRFNQVRDIAYVFVDTTFVGVAYRDHHDAFIPLPTDARGTLRVLVEDQGRVNYGPRLGEWKGMGTVELQGHILTGWRVTPCDPLLAERAAWHEISTLSDAIPGPVMLRGDVHVDVPENLYLDTSGWGKGAVWVNGFNVGRYWSRGPQHTLFVPAELLRPGVNSIMVFELFGVASAHVVCAAGPDLGHTEF